MKLLVCGPRDFIDRAFVFETLSAWLRTQPDLGVTIIHGDATGVDRMAGDWARSTLCGVIACPADWNQYGKAAGPIRNRQMLDDHKPDQVIAFSRYGSALTPGTRNMVHQAAHAGIPTRIIRDQDGHRITDEPNAPIPGSFVR